MAKPIPPLAGHNITKAKAQELINNHETPPAGRKIVKSIKGVVFHKSIFTKLIKVPGCAGIRFYFAVGEADPESLNKDIKAGDLVPTLVAVAIDKKGKDILIEDRKGNLKSGAENTWPSPPHGADPGNLGG